MLTKGRVRDNNDSSINLIKKKELIEKVSTRAKVSSCESGSLCKNWLIRCT